MQGGEREGHGGVGDEMRTEGFQLAIEGESCEFYTGAKEVDLRSGGKQGKIGDARGTSGRCCVVRDGGRDGVALNPTDAEVDADADTARLIDAQQAEILTRMLAILASMLQWEGYQEVVTMLRDLVKLQEEIREETQHRLLEDGGDVFDD